MQEPNPEQQLLELGQTIVHEPTATAAEPATTLFRGPLRAFRHRNYRLFFTGQFISLVGTWLQSVSQGWLVYNLTNSKGLLGVVSSTSSLPILLLCVFTGVIADRVNKRNLIMVTQACAAALAFTLAMLVKTGTVTIYHIIGLAFLLGIVQAFDVPSRQSFVVEMVGKEDLSTAIALNSATFNSARILGPALAGIVIAHFGIEVSFFLNSASFLPVILGLGMMRVSPVRRMEHEPMARQLLEGFRFVIRHKVIRALLVNTATVSIFAMPYAVLMPIFARDILHAGPKGLGYLVSSIGAGALTGAAVLSSLGDFRAKSRLLFAGTLTFGLAITLFSFSKTLWLSMALLVCAGWGMMTNLALTNTLIQTYCPDDVRGRVMSVYVLLNMGLGPLVGGLQAAYVAERFGAPAVLRVGVVACVAVVFFIAPRVIRRELHSSTPTAESVS